MTKLTADDWAFAAAQRLAAQGADSVRIEPLAAQLGVSKGSFYWHFANRDGLLDAVLRLWESEGTEAIIRAVDSHGDPRQRVEAVIRQTFGEVARDGIEVGIRAWARHDPRAQEAVARVDNRRLAYVSSLLEGMGLSTEIAHGRAALLYRTLIGEYVLRSHGHPSITPAELAIVTEAVCRSAPRHHSDSASGSSDRAPRAPKEG